MHLAAEPRSQPGSPAGPSRRCERGARPGSSPRLAGSLRKVAWVIHHFSFITFFFFFSNKLRVRAEVAAVGGEAGKGWGEGGLAGGKAAVHFPEAAARTSKAP